MITLLPEVPEACYSNRFVMALTFAARIHSHHVRKDGTPYMAHLLQVAGIVLEGQGTEEEATAAVLHKAMAGIGIEYQQLANQFGPSVAEIVWRLTEPFSPAMSARDKKLYYLQEVRTSFPSVALVSCADRLHDLRFYLDNPEDWDLELQWFYSCLIKAYSQFSRIPDRWLAEMQQATSALNTLALVAN